MDMTSTLAVTAPALPTPCGPLSAAVVDTFRGRGAALPSGSTADPLSRDLQLALTLSYELHYRGFDGVDEDLEWDADLLRLRAGLESRFLEYLRATVPTGGSAEDEMDALSVGTTSGTGPSWFLRDTGSWDQMREYFAHRSLYHLKEADPHAWAIPRLQGQVKASYVAVEFDEYGGGRGDRLHQTLWSDLMSAADLDTTYLGYVDRVPAQTLAWVNLMSLFGLHRSLRGATVGHFAATEITSSPGSKRLATGLRRLGAPDACTAFYDEHVEADAVHEQILRRDVVGGLLAQEPHLEADIVFGMRALDLVEENLADHLMAAWGQGASSLS